MENVLLHIDNLVIGHKDRTLYEGVSFDVCGGDCVMLCGANGSGKTTLLKKIASMREDVVMIPSRIPKVSGFTLSDFIRLTFHGGNMGNVALSSFRQMSMLKAIEDMGLTYIVDRDISTLSDGEFQKGCIAAALAKEASIIILDEPT